jgi:ADP-ribosylglycohydrolase
LSAAARITRRVEGGAVGDALGVPVEFMSMADIRAQ